MNWRVLGTLGLSMLFAGCAAGTVDEPTAGNDSALESSEDYIGDQGGFSSPYEVDPTKARGFRVADEKPPAAPVKAVLNFTWFGQETRYWCGPGSLKMALSTHVPNPLPTQTILADYMGTTTEGTVRLDEVRALNHYLSPDVPYASIPMDSRPTDEQRALLKKNVVSRISKGWPVVANVLSGWRPPGYPSGTIGHFVAVVGYDQSGDKVLIADPAAAGSGGPRWNDVPKTYWITMQNLGTWVGGRGYSGESSADNPPPPDPPVPPTTE